MNRVDGENGRREPCPWDPQAEEKPPKDERRQSVEKDVDEVKSGRAGSPKLEFKPETSVDERVILRRGLGVGPNVHEALAASEANILGDIVVVVPNPAAIGDDRPVGGQGEQDQNPRPKRAPAGRRGGEAQLRRPGIRWPRMAGDRE